MKLRRLEVILAAGLVGAGVAGTRTAVARDVPSECPPGDWFCDDVGAPVPEPEPAPAPPPNAPEAPSTNPNGPGVEPPTPGMVPGRMDLTTGMTDAAEPSMEDGLLSPWSVNVRLQGIALGSSKKGHDAGLGGIGVSLRYALRPSIAFDLGLDSFGGTDYNGYDRSETSLSLSALLYLNPERQIRTYVLAGLNASAAQVDVAGDSQDWTYLGAHSGLGLEFVLNERVSLSADVLGFIRGRTDSRARRQPEFSDGFGNLTNTSGGGLFRGGVCLYR